MGSPGSAKRVLRLAIDANPAERQTCDTASFQATLQGQANPCEVEGRGAAVAPGELGDGAWGSSLPRVLRRWVGCLVGPIALICHLAGLLSVSEHHLVVPVWGHEGQTWEQAAVSKGQRSDAKVFDQSSGEAGGVDKT
jgi:hypothetical protein